MKSRPTVLALCLSLLVAPALRAADYGEPYLPDGARGLSGSVRWEVNTLSCEELESKGQSLEWWLGVSGCSAWFTQADGTPVPEYLDGGVPPPTCTFPSVLCGDACVDIENDPVNCGGCDARCPDGLLCAASTCVLR